jgi:MFS family permease
MIDEDTTFKASVKLRSFNPLKNKVELELSDRQDEPEPEGPLDSKRKERSKSYSILEGSLHAITQGLTSNFLSAFALALGSSNTVIALLVTLPSLIGAFVQLGVQSVRSLFKSSRAMIVFFAALQAFMWLPLIFIPQLQQPGLWLIFFVTLNTSFGMLLGPVWNSFIGEIVDENERGKFFGRRNMFTGMSAFISTIFAGWVLSVMKPVNPILGFSMLFALAFAFRIMSAYFLGKMSKTSDQGLNMAQPDIPDFIRNVDRTPFGRFTIFLMLFYIAVYFSAPFFVVYQLSILKLSYLHFTALASASAIASFGSMIVWGKHVDKIGSKNVLFASGLLIPMIPFAYAATTSFWVLMVVELFSGFIWAGFNLSVSTYLFDATDRAERTRQLAVYTLLIQLAIFSGAMAGSAFLRIFDGTTRTGFITVFIISGVLRLLVVLMFYGTLQEMRLVEVPITGRIFKVFVSIKPQMGIVYDVAGENIREAGKLAFETPRRVNEQVMEFARQARGIRKPKSAIKEMEAREDQEDFEEYKKDLKP